jgi:hypothetical protein
VPRLLIFTRHASHVSPQETERWLGAELETSLGDGIDSVRLVPLSSASAVRARDWDWMVELAVADARTAERLVRGGPRADLIRDLRLLGMFPSVALAEDGREIRASGR